MRECHDWATAQDWERWFLMRPGTVRERRVFRTAFRDVLRRYSGERLAARWAVARLELAEQVAALDVRPVRVARLRQLLTRN